MQIDLALPRFERKFLKLAAHATITVLALATHAVSIAAPPADVCASAATQAAMSLCAQEDFEEAGSGYAQAYQALSKPLPTAQRDRLRRMQSAWLKFRTEACRFESGPTSGGSAQGFVYWRCAARMTRERTLAMQAMAMCREGDITCTRRVP